MTFEEACRRAGARMEQEWKAADEFGRAAGLEREKRAMMGYEEDMAAYKEKIGRIIESEGLAEAEVPAWYLNLKEGIFNELYGLAGLAPWVYDETEEYAASSSAKLIGEKLYCLINGRSQLQPQTIGEERRQQLKRALLLATPSERLEKGFHEVYLKNGIRITIYSGSRTKEGQDVMVFRKYLLRELTFEKMAELGTLPAEAVRLFEVMVRLGFNVLFTGAVRSGKTTFLQTWQSCEDSSLEGLAISTDPETPWHVLMPEAPIMQLVADGRELETILKSVLRGDNDYVILEEMRDAQAYNLALEITSSGTKRCKATIHTDDPANLPYKIACKIRNHYGGDLEGIMMQVFRGFDYVFEFCQEEGDRSRKKLRSIWEYSVEGKGDCPRADCICRYDEKSGSWLWNCRLGEDKRGGGFDGAALAEMEEIMRDLERRNPMKEGKTVYPRYFSPRLGENPEREVSMP